MTGKIERVPALDLVLDHGRRRVTRGNGPYVELGGQCQLWEILEELCRRYDGYCPIRDLRTAVWGDYPADESTVWSAVSDLRKRLRPLDVTIRHVKGLGYRLEDARCR
jgi:DNA-binding response OmpR family regulator